MRRSRKKRLTKAGLRQADLYEFFCAQHLHHAGNDSYYAKPFMLEGWQRDNIWRPILGTGRLEPDGVFKRAYRRAVICVPRDYGKSEIACAMLMTVANMEVVYNGQYGLIASSEPQAEKLLKKLKTMVALDPELKGLWEPLKHSLVNRETGAEIIVLPYSEAAAQSWHFNFIICDELHVWRDSEVWDAIISGMRDIPNSLCLAITTAGSKAAGFLYDLLTEIAPNDDECYYWWLGANDNDKADDPKVWKKLALPSWITVEGIRGSFKSLKRHSFERYILNRFPGKASEKHAIKQTRINACKGQSAKFDFSRFFAVAIDGATSGDTLAICCYQEQEGKDVFFEFAWEEPDETGYYDFMEVADVIEVLGKKKGKPEIGLDPARMVLLMKYLEREKGIETFTLKQQPSIMCPACEMLRHSIESKAACLSATPILADHAGNCIEEVNKAYGMRFTSSGSGKTKKHIDMAIAASMAMYIYKNTPEKPDYETAQFVFSL